MNKVALVCSLAILSISVMAGQKAKPKTSVKCPVMTDQAVDIKKATKEGMFADYKGRRYFFCCAACKPAFNKNPAAFSKGESIPTPKKG